MYLIIVGMERMYHLISQEHLSSNKQMLFLAGPRQVGKSTIATHSRHYTDNFLYLNWDNTKHRKIILGDESEITNRLELASLKTSKPILVFDEINKYPDWKNYLKGFFDVYKDQMSIIVCGSAKLDIYQKGGDSMMGRYFLYRIHPLSIRETLSSNLPTGLINPPIKDSTGNLMKLFTVGGYPEPFLKNNLKFSNRWQRLRFNQLLREDIIEIKQIENIAQLELLANILLTQAGSLTKYSNLARDIRASIDTVKRWITTLESFYFCFKVTPYYKNVKRSILKEPKVYLYDWSLIKDKGARVENFVASHLLKATHFWSDYGYGEFKLHYLRDKDKNEVDFLVTKDNEPWFLVEVKSSKQAQLSKNLFYFQKQIKAQHAFQVFFDGEYIDEDCFNYNEPIKVPAATFLSQLP